MKREAGSGLYMVCVLWRACLHTHSPEDDRNVAEMLAVAGKTTSPALSPPLLCSQATWLYLPMYVSDALGFVSVLTLISHTNSHLVIKSHVR